MVMNDEIFGTVSFDMGWNKNESFTLWGKDYKIIITAAAYYENEAITDEQKKAYSAFVNNKARISEKIETILIRSINNLEKHLTPRFLRFEKNGAYALLFDDDTDPDNGIAVQLSPEEKVLTQDAYL